MTDPLQLSLTVSDGQAGPRLDRWLVEHTTGWSRSRLQRLIERGDVTVNGRPATAHLALRAGDRVEVHHRPAATAQPSTWNTIRLVAEAPDYLVVEKPAGILVHPTETSNERTLADWLTERFPEITGVGESSSRPGIVHRLDRDVSGLLVAARTPESYASLKAQFQTRTVEKVYLALVHGRVEQDGTIELPVGRSRSDRKRMAARAGVDTRPARTDFTVDRLFRDFTLLRLRPSTGRMHQLRVHLRSIGRPIVGDTLYATRNVRPVSLGRLFLHATDLAFDDLAGDRKRFASPLPAELADFLRKQGEIPNLKFQAPNKFQ